jgi:hypothetical protein
VSPEAIGGAYATWRPARHDAPQPRAPAVGGTSSFPFKLLEHGPDVGRRCEEQSSNSIPGGRPVRSDPAAYRSSWLGESVPVGIPPLPGTAAGLRQVDRTSPEDRGEVRIL